MDRDLELFIQAKENQQDLWQKSVESARQILHARDMKDHELLKIAKACKSLDCFNLMIKHIYRFTRTNPNGHQAVDILFSSVDNSPYSLTEWCEAIETFSKWLDNEKRSSPWNTMLGYLSCCAESPENKNIKHELTSLLIDMLTTYGYDG